MSKKNPCVLVLVGLAAACGAACGDRGRVESKPSPPAPAPVVAEAPPAPVALAAPPAAPVAIVPTGPEIPATFEERMQLGRRLARDGLLDDALLVYRAAAELRPQSGVPHVEMARALLVVSDVKRARPEAEAAVELAPESSSAWNTLGRVELIEANLDAAEAAFERAVEENEDNVWAWNNLGLTRSMLERWEDAVEALERATAGDQVEAFMWNNLGVAYEHVDRVIEARAAYEQAAKRHHEGARLNLARLEAGKSLDDSAELPPVTQ